jgi:hypothetical protein
MVLSVSVQLCPTGVALAQIAWSSDAKSQMLLVEAASASTS